MQVRLILTLILVIGVASICQPAILVLQKDKVLANELVERIKVDQDARNAWITYMQAHPSPTWNSGEEPEQFKTLKRVDAENLVWIKKVVEENGWPGKSMLGKEGAHNAWLLVQHCDEDKPFQRKCLKLMEALLPKGDVDKKDYAYLVDRVLVGEGKKQLYGTQTKILNGDCVPDPIEDEANLDKRRKKMGMPPMAEYLKMVREMYLGKKK